MSHPNPYTAESIRDTFIQFFKNKEHQFVRSSPVTVNDDPTLMFTNAGMNQFKSIFLGENKDKLTRAVNSQKCIRVSGKHNDLDEVGRDTYHHTFFEMLGNWSFGDYYKKEAISWAWELLTEVWKLPKNRLFITVYKDDDEAFEFWKSLTDIEPKRVMRFDDKDNFWEMGEVGPCGPCSEIHFDTGDLETQDDTFSDKIEGVNGENHRYIEIWNLVFIQYQRLQDKSLKPLKEKHVDTGMGFERVCSILQGVSSNYETDIFRPLINKIAQLSEKEYLTDERGVAHRVIADHIRTLTFAIADGAIPSNEGRGYVLRRILRRASRFAKELGVKKPFLCELVPLLVQQMKGAYPEIAEREAFIIQVIRAEEEGFIRTLDQGLNRFSKITQKLESDKQTIISGKDAFTLYDTYGFPLDLTTLLAEEKGLTVDTKGYQQSMKEQSERARSAAKFNNALADDENWTLCTKKAHTQFTGYDSLTGHGKVLRYREENDIIYVALDQTPFYAESGGQVGDQGSLANESIQLEVFDTIKVFEMSVHLCKLLSGSLEKLNNSTLQSTVNKQVRESTYRNHSATHLLQSALQSILGEHIQQQGSRVSADSLRFDFTHHSSLSKTEIEQVEDKVNESILKGIEIHSSTQSFDAAKKSGAMALFGEKYGDEVRVIKMGEVSMELCGGTHAQSTGQIGLFKITSESSISSGVRRIEAVTGLESIKLTRNKFNDLQSISQTLKAKSGQEVNKVLELQEKLKTQEKELETLRAQQAAQKANSFLEMVVEVEGTPTLVASLGGVSKKEMNGLVDSISDKLSQGIAILTNAFEGNLSIISLVDKSLIGKIKAGEIVKELAILANGKGGGRPDRAQAGSKSPEKEQDVLNGAAKFLQEKLR